MYFIYVFYVYLKLLSPKEAKVRESGRGRERGRGDEERKGGNESDQRSMCASAV